MPEVNGNIPAEVVAGLDHYAVAVPLRDLLGRLAAQRAITADAPGKGYVAVRPALWGTVSAYFHPAYVDVALSPGGAEKLHRLHGWKLVKTNSETGFVRIEVGALASPELDDVALAALVSAIDKSEVGTAYEGGKAQRAGVPAAVEVCPRCHLARAQGRCDVCD